MTVLTQPQPNIMSGHHLQGKVVGEVMEREQQPDKIEQLGKVAQLKRVYDMPAVSECTDERQQEKNADNNGFKPIFVKHNDNGIKNLLGLDWSSCLSYYNILRTSQYIAQAVTPLGVALITGGFLNKQGEQIEPVFGGAPVINSNLKSSNYEALDTFLKGEAIVLTGILGLRTFQEFGAVLQNCRLGLSAEFGKPKDDVSYADLFHSENPIIAIERNRIFCKTFSRLMSSIPFAFGFPAGEAENNGLRLMPGLLGSALNIGAERTVFYRKTPYDILLEAVIDVQNNGLSGEVAKHNLVGNFQRALQNAFHVLGQNEIAKKDFEDLNSVFEQLAEDIINKKFGIESVIPIIGSGIIVIGDPEQSIINYNYVREHMVEGVAEEAIEQKKQYPFKKLSETLIREGGEHITPDIAATARPSYVQMERDRLMGEQFLNSAFSRY